MIVGILLIVDDRLVGLAGKVRHIHALGRAEQILKPEIPQKYEQQNGKDADRENTREITHALGPLAPALVCLLRQVLSDTEKESFFSALSRRRSESGRCWLRCFLQVLSALSISPAD